MIMPKVVCFKLVYWPRWDGTAFHPLLPWPRCDGWGKWRPPQAHCLWSFDMTIENSKFQREKYHKRDINWGFPLARLDYQAASERRPSGPLNVRFQGLQTAAVRCLQHVVRARMGWAWARWHCAKWPRLGTKLQRNNRRTTWIKSIQTHWLLS